MPSRHTVTHPAKARDSAPVALEPHETAHDLASGETAVVEIGELVNAPPGLHVLVFTVRVLDADGVQLGDPIEHRHSVPDAMLAADPDLLVTITDEIRDKAVEKAEHARAAAKQFEAIPVKRVVAQGSVGRG